MKYKLKILILTVISLLYADIEIPTSNSDGWTVLNNERTWVGYKYYKGFPWCRASAILPYSYKEIMPIISNFDNYSKIFTRINTSRMIDTNIVYLKIGMPMFFSDRDYVVNYYSFTEESSIIFQWKSIKHPQAPKYDGVVRLINAAGEWRVTPISDNSTKISYSWNGELLGDFPSFYLTQAWGTQGKEIIDWLKIALKKSND